jgi:tetratricopeptide (TPR) repeat protein
MLRLFCALAVIFLVLSASAFGSDAAIVVGVSDYGLLDADKDLKYADEDARLFAKTLQEQLGFAKDKIILLTSKPKEGERLSTSENILRAFSELPNLRRVSPSKHKFVFYFSGHGLNSREAGPFLAPQDYDPNAPLTGQAAELTANKISERLSGINAAFVMAVYDMCRPRLANSLDGSKEINRQFAIDKKGAGAIATIFSSAEGSSFEDPKLGQGVFTYYFCKGITPEPTPSLPVVGAMDDRGNVTLESLRDYVRAEMAQANTGRATSGMEKGLMEIGKPPEFPSDAVTLNLSIKTVDPSKYQPSISRLAEYNVLRKQGLKAYDQKKFSLAAEIFRSAFDLRAFGDERDAWAAFNSGRAYDKAGDPKGAEELYRVGIAANPKYAAAMNNLAMVLYKKGDLKEAEEQYRGARALRVLDHAFQIGARDRERESAQAIVSAQFQHDHGRTVRGQQCRQACLAALGGLAADAGVHHRHGVSVQGLGEQGHPA